MWIILLPYSYKNNFKLNRLYLYVYMAYTANWLQGLVNYMASIHIHVAIVW